MSSIQLATRWAVTVSLTLACYSAAATCAQAQDSAEPDRPGFLDRPIEGPVAEQKPAAPTEREPVTTPLSPPLGYTGHSSVLPRDEQKGDDFVPVEDRWRAGFPPWDRYGWGFPLGLDYPYKEGHWWDPYNQNVFKGDYPIIGQNTFVNITATSVSFIDALQVPTPAHPFESTARPFERDFFGRPNQFLYNQNFFLTFDLFHGDTSAFKPVDWRFQMTGAFNVNDFSLEEIGVVNPDVRKGVTRNRTFSTLEEYFVETKIADLSPYYDFVSMRLGSQPFTSDFRGFIFVDTNRAVRIFGNSEANRDQFNIVYFRQAEKDTNSQLNTFQDRGQDIFIANYYRQDFIWPGYTAEWSVHYNHDPKSFHFNKNDVLVRPDPDGVFQPHTIDAVYLGWAGDGHINRFNISHAFYWALGRDSLNPIGNQAQSINAQFAAVELSYDRDWARFRSSFMWASGDNNINNGHASGFDSIQDNPEFAGGQFSYWQRQSLRLFGVNLVNRESLLPDLRSDKLEGQSNFVNPGLWLANLGMDFDITPKLRSINNFNLLWFDETEPLQQFIYQGNVHHFIGADISTGVEYRPMLSNNIILTTGAAMLVPGQGFRDIYNSFRKPVDPLVAAFMQLVLVY